MEKISIGPIMLKIYDSLSEQKKEIRKPKKGYLKMFVCGPTVYDYSHIGHARTFLIYDAFSRYLRSKNYPLFYLQNITDVDDKIIERAKKEKKSPDKIADFFYREYLNDIKSLNIKSVNKYARASKFIPQIVKQVETLIKKGHAYKIENDGWYFDISTFPEYGKLSKRTISQAEDAVSRIDESIKKRNRGDFCLWKLTNAKFKNTNDAKKISMRIIDGEPVWFTKLGPGRPGWHIEDTAITEKYFGPQYDIHGGAVELKFPHHEAEITQQESASGKKPFVKIWMHSGILLVNGQKMSKSLKNFITIKDFLKKYSADVLRMIVLSHHYRSPLDYNEGMALQANRSLKTIEEFLLKLRKQSNRDPKLRIRPNLQKNVNQLISGARKEFEAALNDDFNTPQALGVLFNFINEINKVIWNLTKKTAKGIENFVIDNLKIFGLKIKLPKIPKKIMRLATQRERLRKNQQFIPADLLRKKIEALGYSIEDTPAGPLILRKS